MDPDISINPLCSTGSGILDEEGDGPANETRVEIPQEERGADIQLDDGVQLERFYSLNRKGILIDN